MSAGRLPLIGGIRAKALKVVLSSRRFINDGKPPNITRITETRIFDGEAMTWRGEVGGAWATTAELPAKKIWAHMAVTNALEACPLYKVPR